MASILNPPVPGDASFERFAEDANQRSTQKKRNYLWVFPKIGVFPQIINSNRVFHEKQHPFWGTPILGKTHIYIYLHTCTHMVLKRHRKVAIHFVEFASLVTPHCLDLRSEGTSWQTSAERLGRPLGTRRSFIIKHVDHLIVI